MTTKLSNSVVSLRNAKGQIVGTGFAAAKRLILTCAHVAVAAGGEPGGSVAIRFHLNGETWQARVDPETWGPPDGDDVAVLHLEDDLPAGVTPVVLGEAEGSAGHNFRAFGYPSLPHSGKIEGLWATGEIVGLIKDTDGRSMLQLASPGIARGMSGGPVLDEVRGPVVGMVTAVYHPDHTTKHRDTGYATPTETLYRACPNLIRRPKSPLNPFFSGGRINDPGMFFGRRRLVREIQAELKKRVNVSLVGESQTGKSSLLYYLYATRAAWLPGVKVAYVDLQMAWNETDFFALVLDKLGLPGEGPRDLQRALAGRDVILLLDEVEQLADSDFNPKLQGLLRALAQEPTFALGVATQHELDQVFPAHLAGRTSPLHNIFTAKSLGPFTKAEAREFLAARLANTGVVFTEGEIERLLADSQCHPARLQQMAQALFAEKVT